MRNNIHLYYFDPDNRIMEAVGTPLGGKDFGTYSWQIFELPTPTSALQSSALAVAFNNDSHERWLVYQCLDGGLILLVARLDVLEWVGLSKDFPPLIHTMPEGANKECRGRRSMSCHDEHLTGDGNHRC